MTKERKHELVAEISKLLDGATGLYSIDFTGLTVADAIRLRREFRNAGVAYKVAKNTLIKRALADNEKYADVANRFVGQTGIAIGYDDPAMPARVLNEFIDPKIGIPKLNFALVETTVFDGESLKALASMPSRKDLMASIVGSLQAPIQGVVGAVNAVMRDLASVIEEVARKRAEA